LLPFIGAGTIVALILWALTNLGIIEFHSPAPREPSVTVTRG
jgi:hypothetical protein